MATKSTKKRSTKKRVAKKTTKRKQTGTSSASGAARSLVIVESPAKARTITKYLPKGFTVKATVGHVRDLPQRELGVDVDNGFAPKYVTIRGKSKQLTEIKKVAKRAEAIFLATDPDREGEAIAWHVAEAIKDGDRIHRVLFHEVTRDAVRDAIANPGRIDAQKVEAQQARRILDRLVGYKASPLLWKSIKTGLSAGRVQTVALRMIVEREAEIRAFEPKEYWSIEADLKAKKKEFTAKLHKIDGKKPVLENEDAARAVVEAVEGQPFEVSTVTKRRRRKKAAPPFITSTLQQEAAKRLGFAAKRTMRAAQDLYEGIEVGAEGAAGLITYMRTDSPRVAPVALDAVREFIAEQYDERYLPATPIQYKSKGSARVQDAHEAIRPTEVTRRPEDVRKYLSPDQFKLYRLIWQRFVASQMTPAEYDTTAIDFPIDHYLFRATGSVMVLIPDLAEGDRADVRAITPNQHFTEPPPRFSEASLVKRLEELGIGRPSTYSAIVSTLRDRDYVRMESRRFHPTDLGETVTRVMVSLFPNIFNVEFTSRMETELDKVEEGELDWQRVLAEFWTPFAKALEATDPEQLIREVHDIGDLEKEPCPECGGKLGAKSGRFGPFIACTNYPECRYTKPLKRDKVPDRPTDEVCKECGAAMVIKTGRYGEFLACTKYPECKHTRPVPLGVKCPKCADGDIAERRSRRGRSFFGCTQYPDCDFVTWYRPAPATCPECGFEGAEQRSTKARGPYHRCLKCEHEFAAEEPATADA
jgi:DNA topoisomerase-1